MMEVNRILGQLWAAVPPAQRQPYVDRAAVLREEWERDHPDQSHQARSAGGSGSGRKKQRTSYDGAVGSDAGHDEYGDSESDAAAAAANGHARSPSLAVDYETAHQLQGAIAHMITSVTDLSLLTLRKVKLALTMQFSDSFVAQHQGLISDMVDSELIKL